MSRLFHGTSVKNVLSIQEEGLLPKYGEIYLTDSIDSACRWTGFKLSAMGENTLAVIEVELDESKLHEGTDHSPAMIEIFGVGKSIVSYLDVATRLTLV